MLVEDTSKDLLLLLDERLEGQGLSDRDFLPISPSCFRRSSRMLTTLTSEYINGVQIVMVSVATP